MSSPKAAAAKPARKPPASAKEVAPAKRPAQHPAEASINADAERLAAEIERSLAEGRHDALSPEALQVLMAALSRAYSARIENGEKILPLASRTAVSPTDVMHTASGLLRGADLQVFELGMWQSWTGR
jgi:hypothetical protein